LKFDEFCTPTRLMAVSLLIDVAPTARLLQSWHGDTV